MAVPEAIYTSCAAERLLQQLGQLESGAAVDLVSGSINQNKEVNMFLMIMFMNLIDEISIMFYESGNFNHGG